MTKSRVRVSSTFLRSVFLALTFIAALAGCGPSIDPAAKADIDGRIAALRAGPNAFPSPTGFEPMPFAAGQWTQYKMTDDKGQPSFFTQKIVGSDAGAFWIETLHEAYTGKTAQRMLVAFGNRTDPSSADIRAVQIKDHKGQVTEMPMGMMPLLQSTYRGALASLVIRWQGLPQETQSVPAGRFDGCYKARTEAQWGPYKTVSDSWPHPAAPPSGTVQSVGIDKPYTMELVGFGTSGAMSEF